MAFIYLGKAWGLVFPAFYRNCSPATKARSEISKRPDISLFLTSWI
jgi:hypothetical protein